MFKPDKDSPWGYRHHDPFNSKHVERERKKRGPSLSFVDRRNEQRNTKIAEEAFEKALSESYDRLW